MTETKKRGGKREGAGRKTCAFYQKPKKDKLLVLKVEQEMFDWLKMNGGSKRHYALLQKAMMEDHIV